MNEYYSTAKNNDREHFLVETRQIKERDRNNPPALCGLPALRVYVDLVRVATFLGSLYPLALDSERELEHVISTELWEGSVFLACGRKRGGREKW